MEPRESFHRLGRRRPLAQGNRRSARRRPVAARGRLRLRPGVHLGAQARDPHAVDRAGRARPDVASAGEALAPERAPLRRARGAEQGRDGGEARRAAGARLAPQLRHPAACALARRRAVRREGPALHRSGGAAQRVAERHGGARDSVLGSEHRARHPLRQARPYRRARQLPACVDQAPGPGTRAEDPRS